MLIIHEETTSPPPSYNFTKKSSYLSLTRIEHNDIKQLNGQLDELNKRLSKARELLLTGDIDANDYRIIKAECEERINRVETQLTASLTDTTDIEPL